MMHNPESAEEPSSSEGREYYFNFRASLRIFGEIADLDEISRVLGLSPTHVHRRGERRFPQSRAYVHDMWSYTAPVARERPLEEHLAILWRALEPHVAYLKELKQKLTVDVFCGY